MNKNTLAMIISNAFYTATGFGPSLNVCKEFINEVEQEADRLGRPFKWEK